MDYTRMLNDRGITQEACADLMLDLDRRTRFLDRQPYLSLRGLPRGAPGGQPPHSSFAAACANG